MSPEPTSPLAGKNIVLGITGSIAAYKAADLASKLRQVGAEVWPAMTTDAKKFITPLTLQAVSHHPVDHDLWSEDDATSVAHVSPIASEFAHGLAPDFLTSLY